MKDDPTAWFESLIEELAAEGREMVEVMGPQIMNRAPMSTPKPKEAQHQEWMDAMMDPNLLMQRYQMLSGLYGPQKGELLLREWDQEHRAMMDNRAMMEKSHASNTD